MADDPGSILESNLIDWIGVIGIFLVVGVALFNFTKNGKTFSLLTLLISFILIVIILIDYLVERMKLLNNGENIRPAVDLLAAVMLVVLLVIGWIIYEVWKSDPETAFKFPLSFIAGEIGIVAEKVAEEIVKHPELLVEIQQKS